MLHRYSRHAVVLAMGLGFGWLPLCLQPARGQDLPVSTSDSNVGYIDNAVPATQFRLRFDAAFDNPVPDRAEFFYGEDGPGGLGAETGVDYQDISAYFELALKDPFSIFVELGPRFIDPEQNFNTGGLADLNTGFKLALCSDCHQVLSFQFRIYAPSGDADSGLGTGHLSYEPGLLYFRRLSDRMVLEGEFRSWIPVKITEFNGEDFAGDILRYGLGLGYDLYQSFPCRDCSCDCGQCSQCAACATTGSRLTSVVEVVGWSVLDGLGSFSDDGINRERRSVAGDTIVNIKLGLRWTSGDHSMYVGYGRGLSGDVWYDDIVRLEYRWTL